jgi:hypothetical protein
MELYSGEVWPDRCRTNQCLYCLPFQARRRCLAITLAQPTRMITLTLMAREGDDQVCDTARARMKLIRRNLKRLGRHPGEWTWTIERNPKETGYHAHALQRGSFIPQDELQDACKSAGAGIPDIRYIHREGIWTSRYGLKGFGADGYGLKSFRANGNPRDALALNNGKLEHHSTEFFALDGVTLKVRDMEREAVAALNGQRRMAYVSVTQQRANLLADCPDLRHAVIRDMNRRQARKLRAMA